MGSPGGSGRGRGQTPMSEGASRSARQAELRRQRQRRRLYPLVGGIVVLVALVAFLVGGGSGGSKGASGPGASSSTTTTTKAKPTTTTTLPPAYYPPPVTPVVTPAEPGEGQWTATDTWTGKPYSVMTTTYRTDPTNTATVAYVAWIRTVTTQFGLYLGYEGPGPTPLDRGPEQVPQSAWPNLLATFNSGFYEKDSAAGFYTHGTLYYPMIKGLATVVSYQNGKVDIIDWQGGPKPGPDIVTARQNLPLLVDDGQPGAGTDIWGNWGITLYGVPDVWRTALGIDAHGNLIYVAAASQTPATLAQILIHVGAVRAMQLDINPEWPILITYGGPGAADPSIFVPNPASITTRFLSPATKDFFAIYRRRPGVTAIPW